MIKKKEKVMKYTHTIEDEIKSYENLIQIKQLDIENTYTKKPPFYRKKELTKWNELLNEKLNKLEELNNKKLELFIELDNIYTKKKVINESNHK